jgi:hypothetical protein
MQQIEVQIICAETNKARLASAGNAVTLHLISFHFGDQEYAVTLSGNRATDQFLGETITVIPGGVDQLQAKRNTQAKRFLFDCSWMPPLAEMPSALTDRRDNGAFR